MKKLLLILLVIGLCVCLFVGCGTVAPPVSGGEGEGETVAEPIIEGLAEEYDRSKMILVEERPWGTPITPGANDRYEWYLPNAYDRSTPTTFYNGSNQIVHHGSAYYIFKSPIVNELAKDSKISITVTRSENKKI